MGKDPDAAARESPGLLKKAIEDAVPIYDYFLTSALKRFDVTTAYGKKKISDELLPVIAKIDNPVIQNHYIGKTSTLLKTSEDALIESMRRIARGTVTFTPSEVKEQSSLTDSLSSRTEKLEVYILALLLQGKTVDLFEELQESGYLPEFSHPAVVKIIDHLLAFLTPDDEGPETAKIFLIKDFADSLPKKLLPTLDKRFCGMLRNCWWSNAFMEEWIRTLREFKRVIIHRQIQDLTKKGSSDTLTTSEAEDLQQKLRTVTMQLKDLENQT
jgi:DNA primase